jgi:hypothetical protein
MSWRCRRVDISLTGRNMGIVEPTRKEIRPKRAPYYSKITRPRYNGQHWEYPTYLYQIRCDRAQAALCIGLVRSRPTVPPYPEKQQKSRLPRTLNLNEYATV